MSQSRVLAVLLDVGFMLSLAGAGLGAYQGSTIVKVISWSYLTYIVIGHLTNIAVTHHLHRSCTHKAVEFSQPISWFYRIVIWINTATRAEEWCPIHFSHHAATDREGDPHAPVREGLVCGSNTRTTAVTRLEQLGVWLTGLRCLHGFGVVIINYRLYRRAARDRALIERFRASVRLPHDWFERRVVCSKTLNSLGILVVLPLALMSLGYFSFDLLGMLAGLLMWPMVLLWTVVWGGIINGFGHSAEEASAQPHEGYSTNILPKSWTINFLSAGESFHNGHHARQANWRFHPQDLGGIYIRIMSALGAAKIRSAT